MVNKMSSVSVNSNIKATKFEVGQKWVIRKGMERPWLDSMITIESLYTCDEGMLFFF